MRWRVICGDVRQRLADLPDASVQTCVTSPPYWGLRDYGHEGQIGLESTPDAYVSTLVSIFADVRRVLTDDGTLWLNLGSTYFSQGGERIYGSSDGATGRGPGTRRNRGASRDTDPNPSPSLAHESPCDNDDKGLLGWTASDSAYSCLCDECLNDFQNHQRRTSGNARQREQLPRQPSPRGRDSEPSDFASTFLDVSPLDVLESTTLESWRRHRGECSRCANRVFALSLMRSSSSDAQSFVGMTWMDYISRLKHKQMVPIPWMVAMALQADGWYLRSDIIWAKPNPMPESVTDRPTKAHEYIFLLSKAARYFYDAAAIREPFSEATLPRYERAQSGYAPPGQSAHRGVAGPRERRTDKQRGHSRRHAGFNDRWDALSKDEQQQIGANKRSVWTVATAPYPGAHFATYPPALIEPCILAGSRVHDTVLDPFAGSGTTGEVAIRHQRNFVGIELNPAYVELARTRIGNVAPLLAQEIA